MSRSGALDTIGTILAATNGDTTFQKVYRGELIGITPGPGPFAAYWFAGETRKEKTLSQVMVWHRFSVVCYWPLIGADETLRASIELAAWNACRDVQTAFRADSQLGGNTGDLEVSLAQVGYVEVAGAQFRFVRFDLELWDLNEEAIAP